VGDVLSVDEAVRVRVQMSHYARELQRERAAREKVAADLKALVGFEAGFHETPIECAGRAGAVSPLEALSVLCSRAA